MNEQESNPVVLGYSEVLEMSATELKFAVMVVLRLSKAKNYRPITRVEVAHAAADALLASENFSVRLMRLEAAIAWMEMNP